MGNKVLVFGTTMFSAEMAVILAKGGVEILGFVVDAIYKKCDLFQNLPVYEFENIESFVCVETTEFALTLGYSEMNEHRESKYKKCKNKGFQVLTYVSPQAQVFTKKIGDGSLILPGTYIGPYSEVGICSVIRPGTVLSHHDRIGDFNWIADGCTLGGGVNIGSHCFLGLGSTVRNEVSIADYTFIGAQTYIGHDTETRNAYIGVPGKKILDKTAIEVVAKV